jgi:cephalosporin hydroxylase
MATQKATFELVTLMNRRSRLTLYIVGILVCSVLVSIKYRGCRTLDDLAINRVRRLAQSREEFKHRWLGVGVIQYPSDLITYAEILYKSRPEVIIETGTNYGGLAVYFATLMEHINPATKILTVDIDSANWHNELAEGRITPRMLERIVFIEGDSVSDQTIAQMKQHANGKRGLVLLDSLHTREHVLKELQLYSQFVAPDSYLIVNDTHFEVLDLMGHGAGKGPLSAVRDFLESNSEFVIDANLPGTLVSCSPSGFLKRVRTVSAAAR